MLDKMLEFAKEKHKGQKREGGKDFIIHPVAVALYLENLANVKDENILCAAFGHDLIEDTDTSYEEIKLLFNDRIADLILELTNKHSDHISHQEKCDYLLEKLSLISDDALLIKLADCLHNLNSVTQNWKLRRIKEYNDRVYLVINECDKRNVFTKNLLYYKLWFKFSNIKFAINVLDLENQNEV